MTGPTVIVLASGRGERFKASGGQGNKLHALLGGRRVLDHTLAAAQASGLLVHVEDSGHPGMGDCIAAAVRATAGAAGWLILPGDLPLIQSTTLLAVARAMQPQAVVIPTFEGERGHPVGFGAHYREVLQNLKGNKGAAAVISAQAAINLIVNDIGILTDIDTPQDLAKAQQLLDQRQNTLQ